MKTRDGSMSKSSNLPKVRKENVSLMRKNKKKAPAPFKMPLNSKTSNESKTKTKGK